MRKLSATSLELDELLVTGRGMSGILFHLFIYIFLTKIKKVLFQELLCEILKGLVFSFSSFLSSFLFCFL